MAFRPATPEDAGRQSSVIEGAVDDAYRIIQEYIQDGKRAAERHSTPVSSGSPFAGGPFAGGPFAGGPFALGWHGLPTTGHPMTKFAQFCLGLLGPLWGGAQVWPTAPPMGPFGWSGSTPQPFGNIHMAEPGAAAPASAQEGLAVAVEVSASQPVEVRVELEGRPHARAIAVRELRSREDTDAPALSFVDIEREPGGVRVRVTAPVDQPTGRYCGPIVDEDTGATVGVLHVTLRPSPARSNAPRKRSRAAARVRRGGA